MKGPNPVWMLATKRLSPSSPRLASALSSRSVLVFARATDIAGSFMRIGRRGRAARRGDHIGSGRAGLIFGRGGDLRPIEAKLDRARSSEGGEIERFPRNGDLAAADAKKSAEIDHRGAGPAVGVDQHVDDQPQILAVRAPDLFAQHRRGVARRQRPDIRWRLCAVLRLLRL